MEKIRLSLEEINAILISTGGLPSNAYGIKSGFWRNAQEQYHSQKKAWLYNGYRAEIESKNGDRPLYITFLKK